MAAFYSERPLREREPAWEMEGAAEMVALYKKETAAEMEPA